MEIPNVSSNGHGPNPVSKESLRREKAIKFWGSVVGLLVVSGLVGSIWYLLLPQTPTAQIRDVFVIGMAVEVLLIGITMVILLIQVAKLVNLVQNEVKPLLESANETLNTVKGTASFLSEAISEPVVKLNSFMAGLSKTLELLNLFGKKSV